MSDTIEILLQGDSLEVLKDLPNDSIDSVVTDPPYGLSFMGKKWDYDVPSQALWAEVLRVLKPGGHLLSFGGTRTYHRMVVAIEDAGFEIRDQIQWLYGSGFPKSHNLEGAFEGWGTALKPANEPIVLARKPLAPKLTVAANVAMHGTGALNIDSSRIGTNDIITNHSLGAISAISKGKYGDSSEQDTHQTPGQALGRWPANIILDEAAALALDEQSGTLKSGAWTNVVNKATEIKSKGAETERVREDRKADSGGASRFFYVAKASKRQRGEGNNHPTVKPIALMEYLIRMVTPPNGTVLDPFMGSGTTGVAAKGLGFNFIGIEREQAYYEIAEQRVNNAKGKAS